MNRVPHVSQTARLLCHSMVMNRGRDKIVSNSATIVQIGEERAQQHTNPSPCIKSIRVQVSLRKILTTMNTISKATQCLRSGASAWTQCSISARS